jgi:hypothetical protein
MEIVQPGLFFILYYIFKLQVNYIHLADTYTKPCVVPAANPEFRAIVSVLFPLFPDNHDSTATRALIFRFLDLNMREFEIDLRWLVYRYDSTIKNYIEAVLKIEML